MLSLHCLPLLAALLASLAAHAAPSAICAFGDSLSPQPPYADATALGIGPVLAPNPDGTDGAYGDALSASRQAVGLQGQVGIHASSGFFPPAPAGALFTRSGPDRTTCSARWRPRLAWPTRRRSS